MATFNFPPTSRYFGVETAKHIAPDGRISVYLRRGFLPNPTRFALLLEHIVTEDERLDTIAAKYMEDPEGFWRIGDANAAMRPQDLTDPPGRRLRITLPEGIPGTPSA